MAKKITELLELTTVATDDLLVVEDISASTTKKITWDNLVDDASITSAKVSGINKSLLTVDSNPYKFSAYGSVLTSLASGAWSSITFGTEEYDTNNNFATSAYTAPVAGFYDFSAYVSIITGGVEFYIIGLYKNSALFKTGNRIVGGAAETSGLVLHPPLLQLAAGDFMQVFAYNGSGGSKNTVPGQALTYWGGRLVCRT